MLEEQGIHATLAILRVGERSDDMSYERGAMKRCAMVGIRVKNVVLPEDIDNEKFLETIDTLNTDPAVHGILMFRPLPRHLDETEACRRISPLKDVDGCTQQSLAAVFAGTKGGFPPCTAQAVIEILDHYRVNCKGKRAVVVGRSLVVGRPLSMLLMHKNATVTICHTKTEDMPSITKQADILVVCAGQMESIGAAYLSEKQTLIDVGIHWNEAKGKLCGDVKFEEAEPMVSAVTPVPDGVGGVTTSVLCKHVIEAAKRV